jgi:hypothetical protein
MIKYGVIGDITDEYMHICETTCLESIYRSCIEVVASFDDVYLTETNAINSVWLLSINKAISFLRCLET